MSYILDALKRSEQERQAGEPEPPDQAAVLRAEPPARSSKWPWIVGMLSLNLVILGVALWPRPQDLPVPTEPPRATTSHARLEDLAGTALQPKLKAPRPSSSTAPPPAPGPSPAESTPAQETLSTPVPSSSTPVRLHELPRPLRERLPDYAVAVHVYTQAAPERFVIIDGKRYREGDTLSGNTRLDGITPRGMILEFEGWRLEYPVN